MQVKCIPPDDKEYAAEYPGLTLGCVGETLL